MGLRSHRGLSLTCLVIQSRTEQFSAVSCRLYSLLLGAEPLEVTSSVGLEGVELLNVKGPDDERRDVR